MFRTNPHSYTRTNVFKRMLRMVSGMRVIEAEALRIKGLHMKLYVSEKYDELVHSVAVCGLSQGPCLQDAGF
jgi:hypothetical protein